MKIRKSLTDCVDGYLWEHHFKLVYYSKYRAAHPGKFSIHTPYADGRHPLRKRRAGINPFEPSGGVGRRKGAHISEEPDHVGRP